MKGLKNILGAIAPVLAMGLLVLLFLGFQKLGDLDIIEIIKRHGVWMLVGYTIGAVYTKWRDSNAVVVVASPSDDDD